MKYKENIILKNGQDCMIRMSDLYVVTHSESDYLLSYPEEYRAEFGIDVVKEHRRNVW